MNGDADSEPLPDTWLRYAEIDLSLMQNAASAGSAAGEICFHAQQATEKALKALLEAQQVEPPRTHDLLVLYELVDASHRPAADPDLLERLAELESQSRYPGDWPEPTSNEATWASEMADSVVQAVRGAFSEVVES